MFLSTIKHLSELTDDIERTCFLTIVSIKIIIDALLWYRERYNIYIAAKLKRHNAILNGSLIEPRTKI